MLESPLTQQSVESSQDADTQEKTCKDRGLDSGVADEKPEVLDGEPIIEKMDAREAKKHAGSGSRLNAFGFARFLAAVHILGFHTIRDDGHQFWAWGQTQVSFFFVLSGFVLTYSQLNKPEPWKLERVITFMYKRVMSIYPLFVVSLIIACLRSRPWPFSVWTNLPFQLMMLQAWFWPQCVQIPDDQQQQFWVCNDGLNGMAWYVSCLVFFWLVWHFTFPRLILPMSTRTSFISLCTALLFTSVWPIIFLKGWGDTGEIPWQNDIVWVAMFNPFSNIHIFFCGIFLAKLFVARTSVPDVRKDIVGVTIQNRHYSFSAEIAFAALFAICILVGINTPVFKMTYLLIILARVGLLVPLQMMLVWGLAAEEGLLAWIFQKQPCSWFDPISYGIYILSEVTIQPFSIAFGTLFGIYIPDDAPLTKIEFKFYFAVLPGTMLLAFMANRFFERPLAAHLAD